MRHCRPVRSLLPSLDALWHVGLVRARIERFLEPDFTPEIEWLPRAPFSEYYADPFVLQRGPELVIACEAYDYATQRGKLVQLRVDGRALEVTRSVLCSAPHHLSFPCVVHDGARTFVLAEQGARGDTRLRELDLARGTTLAEHVLLRDFAAADPILFQRDGTWWLFATDHAALPDDVLHVFHAEHVLGPYLPHARNPIRRGRAGVRAAGLPFEAHGRWFRAVQDGTRRYGGALQILEMLQCSREAIAERVVRELAPWDRRHGLGLHTLNAAGDVTLLDGLRPSRVPPLGRALVGGLAASAVRSPP
jgi:hypothetical protein